MKVINNAPRLIVAGGTRFVPLTPVECDFDALRAKYSDLNGYIADGTLVIVSEAQAKKAVEALEEKSIALLRKVAAEKGIDVKGLRKKADIIEAIKEGK
jgi:hypothetical protein